MHRQATLRLFTELVRRGASFTMLLLACSVAGKPCAVVLSLVLESHSPSMALRRPLASTACDLRVPSATLVPDRTWPSPCCNHQSQSTWSTEINSLKMHYYIHSHVQSLNG